MSKKALGTSRWKRTRLTVLARDGWMCTYCGIELDSTNATVDHIEARVHGGDMWSLDNLTSCCKPCNSKKKHHSQGVFLSQRSTPPVLTGISLRETVSLIPNSPFVSQSEPEQS